MTLQSVTTAEMAGAAARPGKAPELTRGFLRIRTPSGAAWLLGLFHLLVDAISLAVLYDQVCIPRLTLSEIVGLILAYNVVAFGLQFPLGVVSDRIGCHRVFASLGLGLAAASIALLGPFPYVAVAVVGMANALFHVGAGAIVLQQCGGRATRPGIFVAPGALGVFLGLWLGLQGIPFRGVIMLVAAAGAVVVGVGRFPAATAVSRPAKNSGRSGGYFVLLCAILLLGSVTVRSIAGGVLSHPWSGQGMAIALALTLAAVLGKLLGGFLGDRIGWGGLSTGALLAATGAVLLPSTAVTVVISMLLVQLTMAVTLTAMFVAMPDRPGTAFGLPSLALLVGAAPGLSGLLAAASAWVLAPSLLASAGMIPVALRLLSASRQRSEDRLAGKYLGQCLSHDAFDLRRDKA